MIDTEQLSRNRRQLQAQENRLAFVKTEIGRLEKEWDFIVGKITKLKDEQKEILKGK